MNAVFNVSGKAGNIFADDHINFPIIGILNHFIKGITVFSRSAGDALVCIDFYQRPVGMLENEVFIILLLQFIGCSLLDIICRNTSIDSYPLMHIIVVVINLLLFGKVLIVVLVYGYIGTASDSVPFLFLRGTSGFINHGFASFHPHHPGAAASPPRA